MLYLIILGVAILFFHKSISNYLFTLSIFSKIFTLQGVRYQVISFGIICIGMSILLFYWNKIITESKNIPENTSSQREIIYNGDIIIKDESKF